MPWYNENTSNKKIYTINQVPSPKFIKKTHYIQYLFFPRKTQNNGKSKSQILKAYYDLYIYNYFKVRQKLILVQDIFFFKCNGNW